jgi:hypothetical protein
MVRVWRDEDGYWQCDVNFYSPQEVQGIPRKVKSIDEYPAWMAESLTILSCSPIGKTIEKRGKRIAHDKYWVYTSYIGHKEDKEDAAH